MQDFRKHKLIEKKMVLSCYYIIHMSHKQTNQPHSDVK